MSTTHYIHFQDEQEKYQHVVDKRKLAVTIGLDSYYISWIYTGTYKAVPDNVEIVIKRLVCGSHFLCFLIFPPILKVFPFFPGTRQSMTVYSPIYTFCCTKIVISILSYGYFRTLHICVIFFIHQPGD